MAGNTPISSIQVTLRGKKYDIQDVTTVSELQERLSEASGVTPSSQGRVLFGGKRLDASESLSTAGVSEGDQLNVVPRKKSSTSTSKTSSSSAAAAASSSSVAAASASSSMKDLLESSGIDTNSLDDLVKSMGGSMSGSGEGGAPDMKESMEMMSSMMNSPIFQEYMSDPERLEESRQMILNNPMLKGMMSGMPGMEELLNNPEMWAEAMQAAANMYKNMDQDDLMQAITGGAGAAGGMGGMGMPPGLFDDAGAAAGSNAALDELSEGEE